MRLYYPSGSLEMRDIYLTETFRRRCIETASKVNFTKEERKYNAWILSRFYLIICNAFGYACHGDVVADNRVTRESAARRMPADA